METTASGEDRRLRVRVSSPGDVVIESAPLPELVDGEALIGLRMAGVCGSDVHASQGLHPFVLLPYYPGHEVVGELLAMRPEASRLSVGQTVVIEPTLVCGTCKHCQNGNENLCERLEFFGCGYREGGMGEVFSVPIDRVRSVDADLEDVCAVLIEPLATPVHAARLAGDLHGRAVVILGAGTIGLLMLAVVRSLGVRAVVVTDKLESKRSRAPRGVSRRPVTCGSSLVS